MRHDHPEHRSDTGWETRSSATTAPAPGPDDHEHVRALLEAVKESELKLRLLIGSIRDYAIFMLDGTGVITTWNPGAQAIKGYRAEEIIGKHFSIFYPKEDVKAGKCERELEEASATGRFEEEGWRLRKDGTTFWANVVISAMRDEKGTLVGFAKVTRDLTERRRAEEERIRLVHAKESIRLRDEFLSVASHELKTPLTTLQLQLHSLAQNVEGLDEKLSARFDRVTRSSDRLAHLVERLLDVSNITTGQLILHRQEVDLAAVVSEVVEEFRAEGARAGCAIELSVDGPAVGSWDRRRIEQVILNLLTNAFKYASGHPIEVSIERKDGHARMKVADHGPGISDKDLGRIFDRFERVAPLRHYGGMGLGLYLSREIVEAHRGTIKVASSFQGTTFTVQLPLAAGESQSGAQH